MVRKWRFNPDDRGEPQVPRHRRQPRRGWRLIQRISEFSGNQDVANAVADLRHQSGDDVEAMLEMENRVLAAAEHNLDDDIRLDHVLKRVRVLEIAHRMRCNRLRASECSGSSGTTFTGLRPHLGRGGGRGRSLPGAGAAGQGGQGSGRCARCYACHES